MRHMREVYGSAFFCALPRVFGPVRPIPILRGLVSHRVVNVSHRARGSRNRNHRHGRSARPVRQSRCVRDWRCHIEQQVSRVRHRTVQQLTRLAGRRAPHSWTVRKRYSQLREFHGKVKAACRGIPFPGRLVSGAERRARLNLFLRTFIIRVGRCGRTRCTTFITRVRGSSNTPLHSIEALSAGAPFACETAFCARSRRTAGSLLKRSCPPAPVCTRSCRCAT
jgi:hypothetical protein